MANERSIKINERTPKEPQTPFVLVPLERKTLAVWSCLFRRIKIALRSGFFHINGCWSFRSDRWGCNGFFRLNGVVFYNDGVFFLDVAEIVRVVIASSVLPRNAFCVDGYLAENVVWVNVNLINVVIFPRICFRSFLVILIGDLKREMLMLIDRFEFKIKEDIFLFNYLRLFYVRLGLRIFLLSQFIFQFIK